MLEACSLHYDHCRQEYFIAHAQLSHLVQESRALGKSWGRVRVYKLQTICQLVADLQERLNEKHETEHVRYVYIPCAWCR